MGQDANRRLEDYELVARIGAGGTADLYTARAREGPREGQILVLKRILPAHATNPVYVRLLKREARLGMILTHPNLVKVYDCGNVAGSSYLTMEFVDGCDLLELLSACTRAKSPPPMAISLYVIAQVANALAYTHAACGPDGQPLHVVHGDVSPANVLVSWRGEVKLADFGVARSRLDELVQTPAGDLAQSTLRGKLGYMSPEVVTGAKVDHRSDLFALGTMLWEMLTLRRLFVAKRQVQTLLNIRDARVDRRFRKHDYIPAPVQTIIERLLARRPVDRYPEAELVRTELLAVLDESHEEELQGQLVTWMRQYREEVTAQRHKRLQLQPLESAPQKAVTAAPEPTAEAWTKGRIRVQASRPVVHSDPLLRAIPPELNEARFCLKNPDSPVFGPVGYANLVTLLRSRSVGPEELLRVDDGPWLSVTDSALREVLPLAVSQQWPQSVMEGPLNAIRTPQLLLELQHARRDGCLVVSRATVCKQIHLRAGRPVYVHSNLKSELLARVMLTSGQLTPHQVDQGLMEALRTGARLGDILVEQEHLSPSERDEFLERQLEQRLVEILSWNEGWYEFVDDTAASVIPSERSVEMTPLVTRALREHYDLSRLEPMFKGYENHVLLRCAEPLHALHTLGLSEAELLMETTCHSGVVLSELLAAFSHDAENRLCLLRVLFMLYLAGLLTLCPTTAPELERVV